VLIGNACKQSHIRFILPAAFTGTLRDFFSKSAFVLPLEVSQVFFAANATTLRDGLDIIDGGLPRATTSPLGAGLTSRFASASTLAFLAISILGRTLPVVAGFRPTLADAERAILALTDDICELPESLDLAIDAAGLLLGADDPQSEAEAFDRLRLRAAGSRMLAFGIKNLFDCAKEKLQNNT
jgi:hypothetical protein